MYPLRRVLQRFFSIFFGLFRARFPGCETELLFAGKFVDKKALIMIWQKPSRAVENGRFRGCGKGHLRVVLRNAAG
jgi:hypothetical protein